MDNKTRRSSSTKKKTARGAAPLLTTIRQGAIAASIWRRQTSTGFEYLDFSLSRSWKTKNGEKEGYSQNFFTINEEALVEVIREAAEYIRDHEIDAEIDNRTARDESDLMVATAA